MLIEWVNWVRGLRVDELLMILGIVLCIDAPRYAYGSVLMVFWDVICYFRTGKLLGPHEGAYEFCPPVSVIIAGFNEGDTIADTMASVWDRYPDVQLIVVDDGSTDGMAQAAQAFADEHPGVIVIQRDKRGGKSSALNLGLHYVTHDYVITIDADSRLSDNALFEILQPLRDSRVAAVSANVQAWNSLSSLAAWLQAYEYRQTIFVSRITRGRTGVLGIVSGAFGAFRTDVLKELGGWDVGPGEDGDLVLRIRKAGHQIGVAPYAHCYTNVPTSWVRLFKQRCRWDRTVITFECRKHCDLGNPWARNSTWANLCLMAERWFFNVICVYSFWLYGIWVLIFFSGGALNLLGLLYCCGLAIELIQMLVLLFYSDRPWRDLGLSAVLPLYPFYQVFLKFVDFVALSEEIAFRSSGDDNFVPLHVRLSTWRW